MYLVGGLEHLFIFPNSWDETTNQIIINHH